MPEIIGTEAAYLDVIASLEAELKDAHAEAGAWQLRANDLAAKLEELQAALTIATSHKEIKTDAALLTEIARLRKQLEDVRTVNSRLHLRINPGVQASVGRA